MQVLANYAVDEVYLKETPSWMFVDDGDRATFKKFSDRLDEIEEEMKERIKRNKDSGEVPYTVLLPSKIPQGISV